MCNKNGPSRGHFFFLLPLWEKVNYRRKAAVRRMRGFFLSIDRNPVTDTLRAFVPPSHKGRGKKKS
jgi:hypothetical protein